MALGDHFRAVPTSVEPNRARPCASENIWDGVAERSLEPGLEREHRATALASELAFDEGSLAWGQATVGGAWMVGGTSPAGSKSEAAQPTDDRMIGPPQERGEYGGVQGGVEAQQLILVWSPASAGARDIRWARRCEPEPARTAAHSLWGAAEQHGGVIDRAQRQDSAEANVVLGAPPPCVGGEAEPPGARRDRRGRPLRQGRGDLVAAEAVGVAIPHDRVLGCAPPSPRSRAMESELASTEPQRVRAAAESSRERIDVGASWPLGAQHRVLRERVAPRARACQAELASTSTDLFDGSAKAARKGSRGQPDIPGCLAQHRVF
jgi:hypothetical protein